MSEDKEGIKFNADGTVDRNGDEIQPADWLEPITVGDIIRDKQDAADATPLIGKDKEGITMFDMLDERSLFFNQLLDNVKLSMMSRIRARETDPNEIFCWEYTGYDPYNYHGRFMHGDLMPYTITKYMIVVDEATDFPPIGDPRNHIGRYV